jgi:hypothetical protein
MANVLETIRTSLNNMVELQITTEVGPAKMQTTINLLEGDITTKIDPEFITGAYQSLREFHAEREKQAGAIVKDNIEALSRLVELALKVGLDKRQDDGISPVTPPPVK